MRHRGSHPRQVHGSFRHTLSAGTHVQFVGVMHFPQSGPRHCGRFVSELPAYPPHALSGYWPVPPGARQLEARRSYLFGLIAPLPALSIRSLPRRARGVITRCTRNHLERANSDSEVCCQRRVVPLHSIPLAVSSCARADLYGDDGGRPLVAVEHRLSHRSGRAIPAPRPPRTGRPRPCS
jgi:hypothetical protein